MVSTWKCHLAGLACASSTIVYHYALVHIDVAHGEVLACKNTCSLGCMAHISLLIVSSFSLVIGMVLDRHVKKRAIFAIFLGTMSTQRGGHLEGHHVFLWTPPLFTSWVGGLV